MTDYGQIHCEELKDPARSSDEHLSGTYYDAQWVYYQIGDYTHNSYWYTCAEVASSIFRDAYAIPAGGNVPGYWNFTHGLTQDWLRNGDTTSKQAEILLATQASYARDETPLAWTTDSTLSREVAYAIMSYLNAEDLGEQRRSRMAPLVDQALDHIDQWFVTRTAPWVRPFMVGLTSHALISYFERTGDSRILPKLTLAMNWLWDNVWDANAEAFQYTDRLVNPGDLDPAPDLNLLIAPTYAWLYYQTGDVRFRDRGDAIFAGGVKYAWLANGKQFNQNYRLSFEYVRLRSLTPLH